MSAMALNSVSHPFSIAPSLHGLSPCPQHPPVLSASLFSLVPGIVGQPEGPVQEQRTVALFFEVSGLWTGRIAPWLECLSNMHEALSLVPSTIQTMCGGWRTPTI